MHVHLPSTPTFILSSARTYQRIHPLLRRLDACGFNRLCILTGRDTKPYWLGLNETTKRALDYPAPFLILEDDACPVRGHYTPTIEIPDDTDVVNLGPAMAAWASPNDGTWIESPCNNRFPPLQWKHATADFIQVGNMLFTHAVLFMSIHGQTLYRHSLKLGYERDVCDTFAQKVTKTLAPKRTFFRQLGGTHEALTGAGFTHL